MLSTSMSFARTFPLAVVFSATVFVSGTRIEGSSVPEMVTATVAEPPSVVATLKTSVTTCPTLSWFWAPEVLYVQAPAASIPNVP